MSGSGSGDWSGVKYLMKVWRDVEEYIIVKCDMTRDDDLSSGEIEI